MKTEFEHAFILGDEVYHNTPDSLMGIVTNIRYSALYGVDYLVSCGFDGEVWCSELEITTDKRVI